MKKVFYFLSLIICGQVNLQAQCGPTSNLTHQFVTGINTFTWDAVINTSQYELNIVETGAFSPPEVLAVTPTPSFVTPGGQLSATYDYWIVSTCNNGDTHTSASLTFTQPCPEPTNLVTTNVTQTSATFNWDNPYATDPMHERGVILAYRPLGGSWIQLTSFELGSTFSLSNLQPGTTYEWCANLNCSYFDSAPVITSFTTLNATCVTPSAPSAFSITNTTAPLTWTSSGAISHTLQYKPIYLTTWSTVNVNSSSFYTLTNLLPNTLYQARVVATCAGGPSNVSPIGSFTTNCIDLNNSSEHIRFVQIKDKIRVSTADPLSYALWNDPATLNVGSTYTLKVAGGGAINNANKQDVAMYLDVNQNGTFEFSERVAGVGMLHNTNAKSYSFTIPANTVLGSSRLRVVMMKQNQGSPGIVPCRAFGLRGEVEDYFVNIIPASVSIMNNNTSSDETLSNVENRSTSKNTLAFPNPVQNYMYLNGGNISQVTIRNVNGQEVFKKQFSGSEHLIEIDLSNAVNGIFILETKSLNGEVIIQKVIKN